MKRSSTAKQAILDRVEQVTKSNPDNRLQYLMLCASELASREVLHKGGGAAEHFAAHFITQCLQLESQSQNVSLAHWSLEAKDFLLSVLFDNQKLNVSTLYYAVVNIHDLAMRQTYLLRFFEYVRSVNRPDRIRSAILTQCPFSQKDITLVVEAFQSKIHDMLRVAGGDSGAFS